MNINAKDVQMGVFVWEDADGELNIGLSDNLTDDMVTAVLLLTEAIQSLIMQDVNQVAH